MNFLKAIFTLLLISCVIAAIAQPKSNQSNIHNACAIEQATKAMYKAKPELREKASCKLAAEILNLNNYHTSVRAK